MKLNKVFGLLVAVAAVATGNGAKAQEDLGAPYEGEYKVECETLTLGLVVNGGEPDTIDVPCNRGESPQVIQAEIGELVTNINTVGPACTDAESALTPARCLAKDLVLDVVEAAEGQAENAQIALDGLVEAVGGAQDRLDVEIAGVYAECLARIDRTANEEWVVFLEEVCSDQRVVLETAAAKLPTKGTFNIDVEGSAPNVRIFGYRALVNTPVHTTFTPDDGEYDIEVLPLTYRGYTANTINRLHFSTLPLKLNPTGSLGTLCETLSANLETESSGIAWDNGDIYLDYHFGGGLSCTQEDGNVFGFLVTVDATYTKAEDEEAAN